jgi:hypothetical protein
LKRPGPPDLSIDEETKAPSTSENAGERLLSLHSFKIDVY